MKSAKNTKAELADEVIAAESTVQRDAISLSSAVSYAAASRSSATVTAYEADMRHFVKSGRDVPALPSTVAEYLASYAGSLSVATLRRRLVAIHQAHVEAVLSGNWLHNRGNLTLLHL